MNLKMIAAVLLLAGSQPVMADPQSMVRFHQTAGYVGRNFLQSSHWLMFLPEAAEDCDLRIDKANTMLWSSQMGREGPNAALIAHMQGNIFSDDWKDMVKTNKVFACEVVKNLWGEDGSQFPGILKSK